MEPKAKKKLNLKTKCNVEKKRIKGKIYGPSRNEKTRIDK
jgi:hypothetical protein